MEAITTPDNPSAPTAAAPITVDLLHDLWPKILLDMQARDHRVRSLLDGCYPAGVDGRTIMLVTTYPFHFAKLNEQAQRALLETVIGRLVQLPVSIHLQFGFNHDNTDQQQVIEAAKRIFADEPTSEPSPRADTHSGTIREEWPFVAHDISKLLPALGSLLKACQLNETSDDSICLTASPSIFHDLIRMQVWRRVIAGMFYIRLGKLVDTEIELIQDLRTMPYPDYLKTEHWQTTAAAAKERAGQKCQVCNKYGTLHTHHRTYERRGKELPEDLIVLCAGCHKLFHENGKLARRK